MEIRDILDHYGNVIGNLEMPEGTSEEKWAEVLSIHGAAPASPSLQQIIASKVSQATTFGEELVISIAIENITMGITQANKTKEVSDYCRVVARYLREGSLYAAIKEMEAMIETGPPSELAPFITTERMTNTLSKIKKYVGL